LTVTLINLAVGVLTNVICALTRMPNAIGFDALAATLNFIPIIRPIAMSVKNVSRARGDGPRWKNGGGSRIMGGD